jgi:hypothetical protein
MIQLAIQQIHNFPTSTIMWLSWQTKIISLNSIHLLVSWRYGTWDRCVCCRYKKKSALLYAQEHGGDILLQNIILFMLEVL